MARSENNTKARMIATTAELLEIQGYHATGLNQILQESQTPKGALYFHFPGGKEELAVAAIQTAAAAIARKISDVLQSQQTVGAAIAAFIRLIAKELQDSDFRKGCPVATVAMESAATSDRLRSACEQAYLSWFALVEARLLLAGFDSDLAKRWTILVWASLEGALLLSRTYRSCEPLETVAEQLSDLLNDQITHNL